MIGDGTAYLFHVDGLVEEHNPVKVIVGDEHPEFRKRDIVQRYLGSRYPGREVIRLDVYAAESDDYVGMVQAMKGVWV